MTKEQVQNIQEAQTEGEDARERSSIQFPYNDLSSAIEIARAIHANAGTECTLDQLAAYLKQSMTSGAFRLRVSAAATFGLTENERGKVRLTPLGRRITDPSQEAAARADAFLAVPLYARVYENFKGYTLPGAAAIEKFMRDVGVSSKQTDKARQVFLRSARQANFFEHGEDRLVRPASAPGPGTPPIDSGAGKEEPTPDPKKGGGSGSGGGNERRLHPFIQGLLDTIPNIPDPTDKPEWPVADRAKWLQTAANIFDLIYKGDGGIEIKAAMAQRSPRTNE